MRAGFLAAALLVAAPGCEGSPPVDPCESVDPVLAGSAFVLVSRPTAGVRATSPLRVHGCSRTFESNVVWELRARDGRVLASGHTSGGGVSGAAPFSFIAPFAVSSAQLGHLEVYERDESNGEGFPGGRNVIPLVLLPAPDPSAGEREPAP